MRIFVLAVLICLGFEISATMGHATSVIITSPSGTVYGEHSITGTVTFTHPKGATGNGGYLEIYLDDKLYRNNFYYADNYTYTINDRSTDVHGTHTIRFKAIPTNDAANSVETSVTFFNDRTPVINYLQPAGSEGAVFNVNFSITETPQSSTCNWGSYYIYIDGALFDYGACNCFNVSNNVCTYSKSAKVTTSGLHTVTLKATSYGAESEAASDVYVNQYFPKDFPPTQNTSLGPNSDVCSYSSFNVVSGGVNHDQVLFRTDSGPLATDFQLYYDSADTVYLPSIMGSTFPFKTPLGQGWSHSYDISLFKNPDGVMVLRGGGLAKRFFTTSGSVFISQPGDSSVLVKNGNGTYTLTHRDGTIYNFTSAGPITSIVDRYGNTTTISSIANKKQTITDPQGRVTTLNYDVYSEKIISIVDPSGNTYSFAFYNSILQSITYPVPATGGTAPVWNFAYNNNWLMQKKTDPAGNISTYQYDTNNRVITGTGPDGGVKGLTFPAAGTTIFKEPDGGSWNYTFDVAGEQLLSTADPMGNATTYSYDANGRVTVSSTPVDASTSYIRNFQNDAYGNVTDIQGHVNHAGNPPVDDPADYHVGYTYDNANYDQVTSITDYLANLTTTLAYDQDGAYKRTRITSPAGGVTTIRKNANGTVNDIAFPDGKTLAYAYTANKLLQSVTDNAGVKTEFSSFNAMGLPLTVKIYDGAGTVRMTTNIEYDKLNRVTKTTVTGANGPYLTTYGYDSVGNVTVATDANSNPTTRTFNYKGMPKQITDALGKVTTIAYTPTVLPASLTDANGNVTSFTYDTRGLLTKETPPVGVPVRYEYNASGQVTKKINDTTSEALITYSYDPQGRLTGRSYLDGTNDSFSYDGVGRLATAGNQNISYTFAYDGYGRLQSQTDTSGNVVAYGYDPAGRRTSLTVNNAHSVTYGYTADKLTSITSSLAGAFGYGYDNLGRRDSITYPNGITGTYTYNGDQPGWLAGISYTGNLPVYSVSYPTFDKVGNRTAKNEGSLITFGYDAVYRLLNSTAGEVFTYDVAGNRLTDAARLYTVTAGNVMAAAGSTAFTYDSYGNTLTAGAWTYGWNSTGQLVSAANGTTIASYAYDPFGRRISKTVNGVTTNCVYDGQDIAATVSNGNVTHFVHGPGVDEHLAFYNGTPLFYHADGLGSITRITDATQNVVQSYFYDSFGNPSIGNPSYGQPFLFNGREYDPETSLNYHHARYLNLMAGRWLSRDPASFAAGDVNLYGFVGNNSVNFVDPTGLVAGVDDIFVIGSGAVAASVVLSSPPVQNLHKLTAEQLLYFTQKMNAEIDRILQKNSGAQGVQYSLRATKCGEYPDARGGTTHLNVDDVWKYGETTNPEYRYQQTWLRSNNLRFVREYQGSQTEIKVAEKMKIYSYFFTHGQLPPGNKIFR